MPHDKDRTGPAGIDDTDEVESHRYLIFQLGTELYGTPLVGVREVIKIGEIKPLPYMLPHFKGMINLRGQVLGIVDLRVRFQLEVKDEKRGLILIMENEKGSIGAIIDDVLAVTSFLPSTIMQNNKIQTRVPLTFFKGIAKYNNRLVSVIDLSACLSDEDYAAIPTERKAS